MLGNKEVSIADVAGWTSALVTFGLVQGALYLQGYWSRFGLDPFQFVAVAEIALAGLAGIGMVLVLMLIATLLGGWLEGRLSRVKPERRVAHVLALLTVLLGVGAMLWWARAWTVLLGVLLTIICVAAVTLSPVVPRSIKDSPWLVYIVTMIVYVSIASSWLGGERAQKIIEGDGKFVATAALEGETIRALNPIGRLGDTYAFWDPARKVTVLLPAERLRKLETGRALP